MAEKRNYGGRYAIPDVCRKDVFIKVRVSQKEKDIIMQLHSKTTYKNFSKLVRDILLHEKIRVKVLNIDMSNIESQLNEINKKCSTLRSKKAKDANSELNNQLSHISEELNMIKSKLQEVYLCLDDIVVIDKNKSFDI